MSLRTWFRKVEHVEDGLVVRLPAQWPLLDLAVDCGTGTVYLDCAGMASVNCLELGTFVSVHKKLRARGRRLVLCNVRPPVDEVCRVTKLCTLFEIRPLERPRGSAPGGSASWATLYPPLLV